MSTPAPNPPKQTSRAVAGEALLFFGMLMSVGGSLTVIVRGFRQGFFFVLIVLGIVLWFVGYFLKTSSEKDSL